MTGPALELRDVEVTYERRGRESVRAVAGASLTVERGQIVGLVGESGCGKSSLARAAVGLQPTAAGSVLFDGKTVAPLTRRARPRELRRRRLRHASRRDGRAGPDARAVGPAAPSLHRGADPRRAPCRRRRLLARGAAGRGAKPGPAAERLPVPSPLPVRVRTLPP